LASLLHFIEIKSSPEKIYSLFSNLEGVKSWWTETADLLSSTPEVYQFMFPSGAQNKMEVLGKIDEVFVHWKCLDGHDEWIGTEIKFEVVIKEGRQYLRFKHFNWNEESDFLGQCNHFWGFYLNRLKAKAE